MKAERCGRLSLPNKPFAVASPEKVSFPWCFCPLTPQSKNLWNREQSWWTEVKPSLQRLVRRDSPVTLTRGNRLLVTDPRWPCEMEVVLSACCSICHSSAALGFFCAAPECSLGYHTSSRELYLKLPKDKSEEDNYIDCRGQRKELQRKRNSEPVTM